MFLDQRALLEDVEVHVDRALAIVRLLNARTNNDYSRLEDDLVEVTYEISDALRGVDVLDRTREGAGA